MYLASFHVLSDEFTKVLIQLGNYTEERRELCLTPDLMGKLSDKQMRYEGSFPQYLGFSFLTITIAIIILPIILLATINSIQKIIFQLVIFYKHV